MLKTLRSAGLLFILSIARALAGPPFQTDDPEPIEFKNYEFYTFATMARLPGETDTQGPAVEFNWGALPNTHLHIIVPTAAFLPEQGVRAFGLGDMELGIKFRFVQETKYFPQIGTFTMFEIPTGNADRSLGVGKTWYKVPLWAQKSFGPWTTYGGGGEAFLPAAGFRNYPFAGGLLQRKITKRFVLATEAFYHGRVTAESRYATLLDAGGYYKFHGDESFQLLFAYGHSVSGQREQYAYLGLYWTWGEKKPDSDKPQAKDASGGGVFHGLGTHFWGAEGSPLSRASTASL